MYVLGDTRLGITQLLLLSVLMGLRLDSGEASVTKSVVTVYGSVQRVGQDGCFVVPNDLSKMLAEVNFTEDTVIERVADEYGLEGKERALLWAIRKAENGRQGREFGILAPEAMRFENSDPVASFVTQAKWAAGTIKKRYTGNLKAFSERFAPIGAENDPTNLNKNWRKNVSFYMRKYHG